MVHTFVATACISATCAAVGAILAAPVAAEVDAELVRLRAREDLVDRERLLEGLVGDPAELVDGARWASTALEGHVALVAYFATF